MVDSSRLGALAGARGYAPPPCVLKSARNGFRHPANRLVLSFVVLRALLNLPPHFFPQISTILGPSLLFSEFKSYG